ncbi:MAG: isoprenoid biosynthesis glyoxalase ElbB [Candidatus Competibacteraceae bacterium]|nr:isoprenoid biosynthesis glyoxalase ElbB [Candidatus Competibacteraceae bacterium]
MKKIAVILSGCGVYDGAEIHESVFALLAIAELGAEAVCFAPDDFQHHVVNHMTGNEMNEKRNMMVEAARIARGHIQPLQSFNASGVDGLVIPGGFGTAKNLTQWAFSGPDGTIREDVSAAIKAMVQNKKPVVALCMGPVVVAKALESLHIHPELTVGTISEQSPYEIQAISEGIKKTGAIPVMKSVREISIDHASRIISAPCYMMEASLLDVRNNIRQAIEAMMKMLS